MKEERTYDKFLADLINKNDRTSISTDENLCMAEFEGFLPRLRELRSGLEVIELLMHIISS